MTTYRSQLVVLAGLCTACWPLAIFLLCFNYAVLVTSRRKSLRVLVRRMPGFRARRILITGSSPVALRLARAFHETGHHVTVAAAHPRLLPLHIKWSFAVHDFVRLKRAPSTDSLAEYISEILTVVERGGIEVWIDCTPHTPPAILSQAKSLIERKTNCLSFSPDESNLAMFRSSSSFLKFAGKAGLPVPESHEVSSRNDIHKILHKSNGRQRYILHHDTNGTTTPKPQTLLPRRTLSQTYDEVSRIKIMQNSPLRLDQTLDNGERYRATAILANGIVKALAMCKLQPSKPSFYTAILSTSPTATTITEYFTTLGTHLPKYTGHMTLDLILDERPSPTSPSSTTCRRLLPVSANTLPSPALLLFHTTPDAIALSRAYLSILTPSAPPPTTTPATPALNPNHPDCERGIFALGPSVTNLFLLPLYCLLTFDKDSSIFYAIGAFMALVKQILFWTEAMYDYQDPLPWFYFYAVFVPVRLLGAAVRRRGGEAARREVLRELEGMIL